MNTFIYYKHKPSASVSCLVVWGDDDMTAGWAGNCDERCDNDVTGRAGDCVERCNDDDDDVTAGWAGAFVC